MSQQPEGPPPSGMGPVSDPTNMEMKVVEDEDPPSLEDAYALLTGTPMSPVDVPEEI